MSAMVDVGRRSQERCVSFYLGPTVDVDNAHQDALKRHQVSHELLRRGRTRVLTLFIC